MEQQQEEHMQQSLLDRLAYVFFRSDTEFSRFQSALELALWSGVLLWPGDTFAVAPNLGGISNHLSEAMTALLLGGVALLLAVSAWRQWRKLHALGLFLTMMFFGYLTLTILITCIVRDRPASTGVAAYGGYTIAAVWAFCRYMAKHDVIRRRRVQ